MDYHRYKVNFLNSLTPKERLLCIIFEAHDQHILKLSHHKISDPKLYDDVSNLYLSFVKSNDNAEPSAFNNDSFFHRSINDKSDDQPLVEKSFNDDELAEHFGEWASSFTSDDDKSDILKNDNN